MHRESRLRRIVLVHGAAHGAWCWELLEPLLRQKGYAVSTFDLPGLGADPTPQNAVTLQLYIDRVVATVEAGPTPVLLVGHSMGGMPISGAAEAIPDAIGRLVYLAALMPKDGESLMGAASGMGTAAGGDDSAMRAIRPSDVEGAHDFDRSIAREVFYNCCPPDIAAQAARRLGLQATGPLSTPVTLTAERWGRIPKTYIVCANDRALPPARQHWLCDRADGVKKLEMDADHSPFYSDPEGLAEILDREAVVTL